MKHEEKDEVKGKPIMMVVGFFLIIIALMLSFEMFIYYEQFQPMR